MTSRTHLATSIPVTCLKKLTKSGNAKIGNVDLRISDGPTVETISDNGGSLHCNACPHLAKDKRSPLHLGLEAIKPAVVAREILELGGTCPEHMRLPEGFALDQKHRVCAYFPARVSKKQMQPARLVVVQLNPIHSPSLQNKDGKYGLGFVAETETGQYGTRCFSRLPTADR